MAGQLHRLIFWFAENNNYYGWVKSGLLVMGYKYIGYDRGFDFLEI